MLACCFAMLLASDVVCQITAFQSHKHLQIPRVPESVDPPLIVTLVLDTVNVGFQHVSSARQEIARFLRENGGHLAQPVSIFLLTNDGLAAHFELSTDGNALAEQLDHLDARLRTMDRAQGNWGEIQPFAFSMQMSDKILNDQEAQSGRKLLIWVGYGWPMLNGPAFESSVDAQERHFEAIVQFVGSIARVTRRSVQHLFRRSGSASPTGTF